MTSFPSTSKLQINLACPLAYYQQSQSKKVLALGTIASTISMAGTLPELDLTHLKEDLNLWLTSYLKGHIIKAEPSSKN